MVVQQLVKMIVMETALDSVVIHFVVLMYTVLVTTIVELDVVDLLVHHYAKINALHNALLA